MIDFYNKIIQNPTLFFIYILITIVFLRFLIYRFSTRFIRNNNAHIGTFYTGVFVTVTFLFLYLGDSPSLKPAMLVIRPAVFVFITCLFIYRVEWNIFESSPKYFKEYQIWKLFRKRAWKRIRNNSLFWNQKGVNYTILFFMFMVTHSLYLRYFSFMSLWMHGTYHLRIEYRIWNYFIVRNIGKKYPRNFPV